MRNQVSKTLNQNPRSIELETQRKDKMSPIVKNQWRVIRPHDGKSLEGSPRNQGVPPGADENPIKNRSNGSRLTIRPSVPGTNPRYFADSNVPNESVKRVSKRPRKVRRVFIQRGAHQIKVAANKQREVTRLYFIPNFIQEDIGKRVVSRTINNHNFQKRIEGAMRYHCTSPKNAMIESNKIKYISFGANKNTTRVPRRCKMIPVKSVGPSNIR